MNNRILVSLYGITLTAQILACDQITPVEDDLEAPLGAVSNRNGEIPARVWWTEVAAADAYVMRWWDSERTSCDAPHEDAASFYLLPTDDEVAAVDCRGLPSETGQCLGYNLNHGPWPCGAFLCMQLAAEVDGAQSAFSGTLGVSGACD